MKERGKRHSMSAVAVLEQHWNFKHYLSLCLAGILISYSHQIPGAASKPKVVVEQGV